MKQFGVVNTDDEMEEWKRDWEEVPPATPQQDETLGDILRKSIVYGGFIGIGAAFAAGLALAGFIGLIWWALT